MTTALQQNRPTLRRVRSRKPLRLPLLNQLIGLALAVLIPMALFSIWAVAEAIDGQRQAARAQLVDMARAVASAIESEIDTRRAALQALASSPLIDRVSEDCLFHDWAARVGQANSTWVVVSGSRQAAGYPQLVNTRMSCGAKGHFSGLEPTLERVFQTGEPAVANLFTGQTSGKRMIAVAVPVEGGGEVTTVVSMPIEPSQLSVLLRDIAAASGVTLSLVDASHTVVARSEGEGHLIGTRVPMNIVAAGAGRGGGFLLSTAVDGQELAMGFQRLTSAPGWTVIAGVPAKRYEGAWSGPSGRLFLGGALALVMALLLGAAIAGRLVRPMRRLTAAAKALRAGNSVPWSMPLRSGTAELDALAQALTQSQFAISRRAAAQERAMDALARQERRYRALAVVGTLVAWRGDPHGRILEAHGWAELTGLAADTALGGGWLHALHPDDRARALAAWAEARTMEQPVDVEYRVSRLGSKEWRWVRAKGVPVRLHPGGPVEEWVGLLEDAHERRSQEERQVLLAREVDHRAKNALAVVQAALRLTRAVDVSSYVRAVEGRIAALARAHNLLAADQWKGADLHTLLEGELAPFLTDGQETPRALLAGPAVMLPAIVAQPLGMVLHELATNAVKHGALSRPGGCVSMTWCRDRAGSQDGLRLRWQETGGPPVAGAPARRGFGSRVVESTVRNQLRGEVSLTWAPEGLVCEVLVPLPEPSAAPAHPAVKRSPAPMLPFSLGGAPRMA